MKKTLLHIKSALDYKNNKKQNRYRFGISTNKSWLPCLALFFFFSFSFNGNAQTTIYSSGFEPGDAAFTSSIGPSTTITQPIASNPRAGTNSGKIVATANNTSFTGSIISSALVSFVAGRYYTVSVWAKAYGATSTLKIKKSATATNAAMIAAAGNDIFLSPAAPNVTTSAYVQFTGTILATLTENKYVGIQVVSGSVGGQLSTIYIDDISIIENTIAPCGLYCTSAGTTNTAGHISNVTFNTINNTTGFDGYACTGAATTVIQTVPYNLSVTKHNNAAYTSYTAAWIDWNKDGVFNSTTEYVLTSASTVAAAGDFTRTVSVTIPGTSALGITKMRVFYKYLNTIATNGCDNATIYEDVEDYDINIIAPAPCATPTAQPTSLSLTPTGSTIIGSFTAASPASDNYLVVINTSGVAPSPVNSSTYSIGSTTLGGTNVVVDNDNTTSFTATGLTPAVTYYLFVYSFNSMCTGGPLYYTASPLNGSVLTTVDYCTATVTSTAEGTYYITKVSFDGTLNDVSNTSTYSSSPIGYQDFSALPNRTSQAQGEGINVFTQINASLSMKAWVDWNKDGDFLDSGEQVFTSGTTLTGSTTFGFIVPATAAPGNYRIRIRVNSSSTLTSCGNIANYGETEDYLINVVSSCPATISTITPATLCGTGSVSLSATAAAGTTEYRWYSALTGGSLLATTASGSWSTPSISATTTYYVTAFNGSCESLVRTAITATINAVPTLNISPANPIVCGEQTIITLTAAGSSQTVYLIDENFETGLNNFTNVQIINNGATINAKTAWQTRASTFIPAEQVWFPAISSGFGTNKFVMSTSDVGMENPSNQYKVHTALVSPTVSSMTYTNLTLSFRAYYSRYFQDATALAFDYVTVDVSIDAGATWTEIQRYTTDIAFGTAFQTKTFNLNAYINRPNLKVRVRYYGEWCDGIAVDDVKLYGTVPMAPSFNWTSATPVNAFTDFACTTAYVEGTFASAVYVQPNLAQLELGLYTFTASVPLLNGCSASQVINVTNNSRVWQGFTSDWNDPNNWKPLGVPTSASCVIIPSTAIISGSGYNGYALNLLVKSTGILELQSNNNLTVTDYVSVETGGVFDVKDSGSLVQINTTANNVRGTFKMERITQPMYRYDYTYWGSPVTMASNFTLGALSPLTLSDKFYSWTPSVGGSFGNWAAASMGTVMDPRKGYIIRAPQTFSASTTIKVPYQGYFAGTPNNGTINSPISYGTLGATSNNDKYNLLANPYPSAISAAAFLNLANNANVIDGTIYFWTHNSAPSTTYVSPFYNDFITNYTATDYASWNKLGGTGTSAVSGGSTPNGYIAAGQGFFTRSLGVAGNAFFDNTMRRTGSNNQFFRNTNPNATATVAALGDDEAFEKHRIWLNLVNNSGAFNQILVGYAEGATNDWDRGFDGLTYSQNSITFYSIIPTATLVIQGRALPFNVTDQVPLGYKSTAQDTFSIRIDHLDGLFENTNVYVEDKLLNITHDLKSSPYTFTSGVGTFNDRFILRYANASLAVNNFEANQSVTAFINKKQLTIAASQNIEKVEIYDVSGKIVQTYLPATKKQEFNTDFLFSNGVYFARIKLESGLVMSKKLMN